MCVQCTIVTVWTFQREKIKQINGCIVYTYPYRILYSKQSTPLWHSMEKMYDNVSKIRFLDRFDINSSNSYIQRFLPTLNTSFRTLDWFSVAALCDVCTMLGRDRWGGGEGYRTPSPHICCVNIEACKANRPTPAPPPHPQVYKHFSI
jgi:hypothetical protein